MGFEAPLMLLGLLGAALPVVAHLMRRRDLPVIALPTVLLLSRAQARSRRRMHIVDIVLLCARILLVAALAVAVADPYVPVRLSYGDGRVASVAIVLDDSMSMARRGDGATTLLEDAREAADEAIASLPAGSEVSVVLAGAPPRLLVPRTRDLRAARNALSDRVDRETARDTELAASITRAVRELTGARLATRRLLVLTDDTAHARLGDVRWPDDGIAIETRRFEGRTDNRAIVSARAVPDPTTPGQASLAVEVRRFGAERAEGDGAGALATLRLRRGTEELATAEVDLSTGGARATLHAPLIEEGDPTAHIVLEASGSDEPDALTIDDARAVLLRSPSSLRVLLVDGDPHASGDRDEVGYLTRALDFAPADPGLVSYRVVDPDAAEALDLAAYDVVVLANVRVPSQQAASRLTAFVEGGGGLLVTAGDRVDPAAYQARLGSLLAARPRTVSDASPPASLAVSDTTDLLADAPPGVVGTSVRRRMVLDAPATGARVALSFDDGTPALVTAAHGAGRTAMLALPLDTAWSDLPFRPFFLPLTVELLFHLGPRARLPRGPLAPGETVEIPPPSGADRLVVVAPDGERFEHVGREPFLFEATESPGAYRVLASTDGAAPSDDPRSAFVVAPPAAESDLTLGGDDAGSVAASLDGEGGLGTIVRKSVAPWFFLLVGLLAVLEAGLRHRKLLANLPGWARGRQAG